MPASFSNLTMYVLAKDIYLKGLLNSGKISVSQYNQMSRFLYQRFDLEDSPHISWESAEADIPIASETVSQVKPVTSTSPIQSPSKIEFVSLTDIARTVNAKDPGYVIASWMRSSNTMDFLALWEQENNPAFDADACTKLRAKYKASSSNISPKQWISEVGAIGLRSKAGKSGGTFAHPTILCEFLMHHFPKYKLALIEMAALPLLPSDSNM